jgi:hypothetical protein
MRPTLRPATIHLARQLRHDGCSTGHIRSAGLIGRRRCGRGCRCPRGLPWSHVALGLRRRTRSRNIDGWKLCLSRRFALDGFALGVGFDSSRRSQCMRSWINVVTMTTVTPSADMPMRMAQTRLASIRPLMQKTPAASISDRQSTRVTASLFSGSGVAAEARSDLGNALFKLAIAIAERLRSRQCRCFMLVMLVGPRAQVSDRICDTGARPIE